MVTLGLAIVLRCAVFSWTAALQADTAPTQSIDVASTLAVGDEFATPLDEASAARIDELIARLSAASYDAREQATRTLIDRGVAAFARLREAYRRADDLEVRLRIEAIVKTAYLNHHVLDQKGFLGIRFDQYFITHDDEPQIQEGHVGVKIMGVVADTAASRAGLAKDDVIIALDGNGLVGTGPRDLTAFGEGINARKPGTEVRISVLRGTDLLEIDAVLGRAPLDLPRRGGGTVATALVRARENFDQWWDDQFRIPPADASTYSNLVPAQKPH